MTIQLYTYQGLEEATASIPHLDYAGREVVTLTSASASIDVNRPTYESRMQDANPVFYAS